MEDIPNPILVVAGAPNTEEADVPPKALLLVDDVPNAPTTPDVVALVPKGPTPPNEEGAGGAAAIKLVGELP